MPERKYPSVEQRLAFYERLEERLRSNPKIEAVTITSNVPMQGGFLRQLTIDGRPLDQGQQAPNVTMLTIDPRYFKTVGLSLQRGRDLTDEDGMTGRESVIVNQRFAALHFPGDDPIGRRITLAIDLQGGAAPQGGIPVSHHRDHRRHRAEPAAARFPTARSRSNRLPALPNRSARLHEPARCAAPATPT